MKMFLFLLIIALTNQLFSVFVRVSRVDLGICSFD